MFIYVLRRALYSLPVLLIATFLVFAMVSATFDPDREARADARRGPAAARVEAAARPRPSAARAVRLVGLARGVGRLREELPDPQRRREGSPPRVLEHLPAHHLGHHHLDDRGAVRRRLQRDEAVLTRRLHTHRPGIRGYRHASVLVRAHRVRLRDQALELVQQRQARALRARAALGRHSPASTGTTCCTSCCRSRR